MQACAQDRLPGRTLQGTNWLGGVAFVFVGKRSLADAAGLELT